MEWYQNNIVAGFTRFPYLLLSMVFTYVFIQILFLLIPPLRKLMLILALPFRYMHVWLHVDAAKKVNKQKNGDNNKTVTISLWTQLKGKDCAQISLEAYSTRAALKIASAPLKGAIALLLFIILSSPILARLGLLGLLIHIYLIFSCFGVAWPSFSDYSFVYQGAMIHPDSFSPGYLLWIYFIFAISGYITLNRTGSAVSALMDGLIWSIIYLVGFLVLTKVLKQGNVNIKKKYHFFNRLS